MIVVLTAVPLAVVAALMAWLISYDELSRHYAGRRTPMLEATRRAAVVLVFFLVLGAIVALAVGAAHA
jgi:hypothetical protein